jgi:Protein of unknown function (DUF2505)
VHFRIEQTFPTDPSTLCAALVDPLYLTQAMGRLPDIGAPVVVSQVRDPATGAVRQSLRYAFNGRLPSAVTRVISPDRLTWIEDSTVDLTGHEAVFRITPEHYRNFFGCSGKWTIHQRSEGCSRVLEGTLKVNSPVPFVGGQVERAIVSGLRERLAHEPAAFVWWVAHRGSSR